MSESSPAVDVQQVIADVEQAVHDGKLSESAAKNIQVWLTEQAYNEYRSELVSHITEGKWQTLDDVFWTIIPFGTGGRRGKMYPIGSNAINNRTIGESAQGLADYVHRVHDFSDNRDLACAIAYDTRHRSREFAELCSEILVASGFKVYFLDGYRSTPELSYAVRYKKCNCGIMVTASHNPPSDNAVKVYWSTGGQLLPPHDKGVIDCVGQVDEIKRANFSQSLAQGKVVMCQEEVDLAFLQQVKAQALPGPRDLKIIYSPLHGVGASAVLPVLEGDGFQDVEQYAPHAQPDGDFPNVPGHVSNPENPRVFDAIIERGREVGAELILATDPDCDRVGCAAPRTSDAKGEWGTFTGNQIGALLTDYLLSRYKAAGRINGNSYIVKTLVTTEMIRRIADYYGVKTYGNLLVGFKWIGGIIDEVGPANYLFGAEESHGYQVGDYTRDKDGAVAAMMLAELTAQAKADGQTLHEKLDSLYWQFGCHMENTVSVTMPGSQGMERMKSLMQQFRDTPPSELATLQVTRVRDYQNLCEFAPGEKKSPFDGPKGDMVIIDLQAQGNYIAVRPSGTEPKVKFYMFAYEPAEQISLLEQTKQDLQDRLEALHKDLANFAEKA